MEQSVKLQQPNSVLAAVLAAVAELPIFQRPLLSRKRALEE
jgi:hypothetical protein